MEKKVKSLAEKLPDLPLSGSAFEPDTLIHGKQSILLSSALKKSKQIKATNAVTCRRKSNKTANAAAKAKKRDK